VGQQIYESQDAPLRVQAARQQGAVLGQQPGVVGELAL